MTTAHVVVVLSAHILSTFVFASVVGCCSGHGAGVNEVTCLISRVERVSFTYTNMSQHSE
jgi:hypothetical protein